MAALYLLAGIAALLLIPASLNGWLGIAPDPLSGVFALLLALPWSLALRWLDGQAVAAWLVCAAGISANTGLLLLLARTAGRRSRAAARQH